MIQRTGRTLGRAPDVERPPQELGGRGLVTGGQQPDAVAIPRDGIATILVDEQLGPPAQRVLNLGRVRGPPQLARDLRGEV